MSFNWKRIAKINGARINASDAFDQLTEPRNSTSGERRQRPLWQTVSFRRLLIRILASL